MKKRTRDANFSVGTGRAVWYNQISVACLHAPARSFTFLQSYIDYKNWFADDCYFNRHRLGRRIQKLVPKKKRIISRVKRAGAFFSNVLRIKLFPNLSQFY